MAKTPSTFDAIKRQLSDGKTFGKTNMVQDRESIPAPSLDAARSEQAPQFKEDAQARGYDNDVPKGSWLDGGKQATSMPNFDHSPKRGKERR